MTDTATDAYSSFTVNDLESTRTFYQDVLGLRIEDRDGMLFIHIPGGAYTVAYAHPKHQPARFTILNIVVPDLPSVVTDLTRRGIEFEHYEGTPIQIDPDEDYPYDPDTADNFSGADYFPDNMDRETYYQPTRNGYESQITERLRHWSALRARRQPG